MGRDEISADRAARRIIAACRRADAAAAVANNEAEYELPELTGSSKQVAWARKIRNDKLTDHLAYLKTVRAHVLSAKQNEFEQISGEMLTQFAKHRSASWWINVRNTNSRDLATKLMSELNSPTASERSNPPQTRSQVKLPADAMADAAAVCKRDGDSDVTAAIIRVLRQAAQSVKVRQAAKRRRPDCVRVVTGARLSSFPPENNVSNERLIGAPKREPINTPTVRLKLTKE